MLMFADGSTLIIVSLYFRFISREWIFFQLYGITVLTLTFLGVIAAPESPKYLYSVKKYYQARAAFEKIARFNKIEGYDSQYLFDLEERQQQFETDGGQRYISLDLGDNSLSFKPQNTFVGGKLNQIASPKKRETGSILELIRDRDHIRNLLLLLILWSVTAFDYNLINF